MQLLLTCRKFEVVRRTCSGSDGRMHEKEFVVHPGAVVVLAFPDAATCILVRQFRPAIGRELWELPAGTLDVAAEDPAHAAGRELEEETGFRAGTLTKLCEFYPSPGILTELIRAYVATGLMPGRQRLDPTEQIRVEPTPVREALRMILDGRIVDAKTIVALLRWRFQNGEAA